MTSGTRFRQGHDAKLKAVLIREAIAGDKRAAEKLESLGWSKFLEAKRAKLPQAVVTISRKRGRPRKRPLVSEAPLGDPSVVNRTEVASEPFAGKDDTYIKSLGV